MNKEQLLEHLRDNTRVLTNESLEKAFGEIDRAHFAPEDYVVEAYEDYALPLPHGQNLLQPSTVAFMLELLAADVGETVLNIGVGSGYSTALLSTIVGSEGKVVGLEVIPELVKISNENISRYNFTQTTIEETDARWSALDGLAFDRILVTASADSVPEELIQILNPGGTLVMPIGDTIIRLQKINDGEIDQEEFPGFSFEPLI